MGWQSASRELYLFGQLGADIAIFDPESYPNLETESEKGARDHVVAHSFGIQHAILAPHDPNRCKLRA